MRVFSIETVLLTKTSGLMLSLIKKNRIRMELTKTFWFNKIKRGASEIYLRELHKKDDPIAMRV